MAPKTQDKPIETMNFMTGARYRSGSIVIRGERSVLDLATGQSRVIPGLRVRVHEHKIDLQAAANEGGWDALDDMEGKPPGTRRKIVETALLKHPDFGRSDGRGIFVDSTSTMTDVQLVSRGAVKKCVYMQDLGPGEGTQQCNEAAKDAESDFCETHEAFVIAAQQRMRDLTPPAPPDES